MSKLFIQLGRNGDILNILPLLHKDSLNGEKPRLMVAAEYQSVLEGVSYVEPVIYEGPHYEIQKAYNEAVKQNGGNTVGIVCAQVNGPQPEVAANTYERAGQTSAVTTSYQKESWKILGRLNEWDDLLPLVFDKRDAKREAKLLREHGFIFKGKKKPVLLLSLGGSSSPFPHADLLRQLVTSRFSATHRIVELPKAERIYDLLALYERAELLIATDSAPLHLAWACRKLPVFALANDKPLLWNGSSWRPNHQWYCRYSDFPTRAMEMLQAINEISGLRPFTPAKIVVWSQPEPQPAEGKTWCRDSLTIVPGMCGRDSVNTLQDSKRVPYLKDVIRMAMQRCAGDETRIILRRPDTDLSEGAPENFCFAYRLSETDSGLQYQPIVDLFCATRAQWKAMLPEIPDLLLSSDYFWSQCLWAIFVKHGAKDETGICTREAATPKPFSPSKAREHNTHLCAEYMSRSKVFSRYPKLSEQAEIIPLDTVLLPKFAYNPSLCRINGKLLMSYRYHPDASFNTRLGIADLSDSFAPTKIHELTLAGDSQEDARLFSLHGEPWMSWVEAVRIGQPGWRCVVKYSRLDEWTPTRIYQNKVGGNDGTNIEKNWVYFESDENLFCVYDSWPIQTVLHVQGDTVINEHKTTGLHWPYGTVRGGSIVPWEDKLLRIFHSSLDNEHGANRRRYFVGACLMKNKPPFEMVSISRKPVLYGSEIDMLKPAARKGIHHYKPNVVFPCGAIVHEHGVIISVGVNDAASTLVKVQWKDLNL